MVAKIKRNFYRPKRSFGQGNIFTCVCDSGGGGSSKFSGGEGDVYFSGGGSSKFSGGDGYFSGGGVGGVLHWNTVNVRPVRILLECILFSYAFAFTQCK